MKEYKMAIIHNGQVIYELDGIMAFDIENAKAILWDDFIENSYAVVIKEEDLKKDKNEDLL